MNFILLEKLTIVIFTYNRHKYLRRTLDYWCNYNLNLVILDGSDKRFEDPRLERKNIKYIYNTNGLYDRLSSSVNYIDTEFLILSADDEFYLPSALRSCVNFLINNESYSSCGGRSIGFGIDKKNNIYGKQVYQKLKNLNLNNKYSYNRIINHFSNYVPAHFYSVIRSNKWKKICPFIFKKKYDFFGSIELQLEFLVLVSGKSKVIPELMWMRSHGVPQFKYNLPQNNIQDWWSKDKFKNEKLNFLKELKKVSNEILTYHDEKFTDDMVTELFEIYIKENFSQNLYEKKILNRLIYLFKLKQIKRFIFRLFKNKNYVILKNEIKILEEENVVVNHKDLNKVISTIESSNVSN